MLHSVNGGRGEEEKYVEDGIEKDIGVLEGRDLKVVDYLVVAPDKRWYGNDVREQCWICTQVIAEYSQIS